LEAFTHPVLSTYATDRILAVSPLGGMRNNQESDTLAAMKGPPPAVFWKNPHSSTHFHLGKENSTPRD
jgi:hypothetical protein